MSLWTRNSTPCSCLSSLPPKKRCVLPLLLFCQSYSISFHRVQGCSICTCSLRVFVSGDSSQLFVSLCSLCQWWCCLSHESSFLCRSKGSAHSHKVVTSLQQERFLSVVTPRTWWLSTTSTVWFPMDIGEHIEVKFCPVVLSKTFALSGWNDMYVIGSVHCVGLLTFCCSNWQDDCYGSLHHRRKDHNRFNE